MAKNQFIRARVAGWEKERIRRKAKTAHMSESEFVRRAAMEQGRITQVNYEPFMEVYRGIWQTLNSLLSHAV